MRSVDAMHVARLITFEDFEVDLARRELRKAGVPVSVEPQVFDLVALLSASPGELFSRDDLIRDVWGGRIVSDSAIASRINAARAALGDNGQAQRLIKTIPRKGFRFETGARGAGVASSPGISDKPSVAVLPFQNLSGDPEQAYFSDGITDDIITDLSRYAELFISARHSSFAYRDMDTPIAEIARGLGVQYIVEGSVRRAGDRIRVSVQLVDPSAGNELWAERYDREMTDIFEVQDEITSLIVNTLAGQLVRQHYQRSLAKSTDAVTAYDYVLRALELNWQFDTDTCQEAIKMADRALALDPQAARAHAIRAWAHLHFWNNALSDDPDRDLRIFRSAAHAAVTADNREPLAHATLAWVYQFADRNPARCFAQMDRAIALNPGSTVYRSLRAFSMTYAGRSEEALATLSEAMKVNPHYPVAYHIFCGRALFNLGRYAEAVTHLEPVRAAQRFHPNALALAAACYEAAGRHHEAQETVREVRAASARFTIGLARRVLPYSVEAERDRFLSMLAAAGLPE